LTLRDKQRTENYTKISAADRKLNVFRAGQTYYVFFVYAKQTTRQHFQIYVGTNFDTTNGLKPVHVNIESANLQFDPFSGGTVGWLMPNYSQVKSTGILRVGVNFKDVPALSPTPEHGLCQPHTFCKPNPKSDGNSCVSALAENDRLKAESDAICGNWAVKDLDCPPFVKHGNATATGGCFGFSFTLPAEFRADNSYHRPNPGSFPPDNTHIDQGEPDWAALFKKTTTLPDATSGRCYYQDLPDRNCPKP
jgi:hypothetical protein